MDFVIDKMKKEDWNEVAAIYREGISTGNSTLETDAPEWEEWNERYMSDCRLVARTGNDVVGWIALIPASRKPIYRGVAEISLYVKESLRGQGIGKALLRAVIEESEKIGMWTLQGMILPENRQSIALCKGCGFREVGYREHIGQREGIWRDVILMERRSKIVGV
jgi:L-amino acid N-acyltransferase YncA